MGVQRANSSCLWANGHLSSLHPFPCSELVKWFQVPLFSHACTSITQRWRVLLASPAVIYSTRGVGNKLIWTAEGEKKTSLKKFKTVLTILRPQRKKKKSREGREIKHEAVPDSFIMRPFHFKSKPPAFISKLIVLSTNCKRVRIGIWIKIPF